MIARASKATLYLKAAPKPLPAKMSGSQYGLKTRKMAATLLVCSLSRLNHSRAVTISKHRRASLIEATIIKVGRVMDRADQITKLEERISNVTHNMWLLEMGHDRLFTSPAAKEYEALQNELREARAALRALS